MTEDLAIATLDLLAECGCVSVERSKLVAQLVDIGHAILEEKPEGLLVLGVPGLPLSTQQAWFGMSVGIWPRTAFEGRRVAVVSSRLGRKLGQHSAWFDAFRTLACQFRAQRGDVFVTADGTTADRFVKRAASLFDLPAFLVRMTENSPAQHIEHFHALTENAGDVTFSKPVLEHDVGGTTAPLGDRLITALANHIRALSVKRGSTTHELLCERLSDEAFPPATVQIASQSETADELAALGAIPWILLKRNETDIAPGSLTSANILRATPFDDYLLHWTRSPDGPWPDEDIDEYLDKLILGVEASDRTAFAALSRIVQTKKIVASSHLIRGRHSVVCFTDVTLGELASRRTFRPHLRRWDYEPYGVGIRKSQLTERGARPVVYGTSDDFASMPTRDQPFFQQAATADNRTQWTDETEWRCLGNVDLNELSDHLFLFVPTRQEAIALGRYTASPVVFLSDE